MAKLTAYNIAITCLAALGAFSYGFGFAIFVTSIGQPGFYTYFNLDPTSSYTANILGAISGLFNFGLAAGALVQGWLSDAFGRKKAFAFASICSLIGGALVAGSAAIPMLITVRMLQGFGLGILVALVPLYATEVAPPHRRGMLSGLTAMNFALGYLVCAWVSVGTYYAKDVTLQWRLPLALGCLGPLIILIGLPFLPESPRFLTMVGKSAEALEVLRKIHHDPNDPEDRAARAEYTQIMRQTAHDREEETGYIKMFTKPSWRKRTLLAMFIQFAAQSTGVLAIANFLILIFGTLGMTGAMPLILYGVFATVGNISLLISLFVVDRIGRRKLFLIGFPGLAVILLIEALLQRQYLDSDNKAGLGACAAMFYLYVMIYNVCIDAPSFIWISEIFPTTIRSKGVGLGFFAYSVGAITYTTPSALEFHNVKYNIFYLYMGLCLISTVVIYFFVVETKGLPVEEIGALFGDKVVAHLTADGQGIVEDDSSKAETDYVEVVEEV
ncbi:general substrate transporter [Talaromyces proteolyticus]|uniref:General substrate transporter n=1 Tax=Talaromyces proteolyticus TaxID=1131652 RepID=A0AAD4KRZ1_9EURO|nr:general substrate transporter [Talaromyces proteolyticus]KAH8697513.1 general substrate transporter [Talaromyces proteolyticus]